MEKIDKEKAIDKIEKLFALAGNNPSKEQAEFAMIKAQEFMARYHIDVGDINQSKAEAKQSTLLYGTHISSFEKLLSKTIANNFRCRIFLSGTIQIVGEPQDIKVAQWVYGLARKYYQESWKLYSKLYVKTCKDAGFTKEEYDLSGVKADYTKGFLEGIKDLFNKNVSSSSEMSLMVVTPKSVTEYFSKLRLRTSRLNVRRGGGYEGARAGGYQASQNFKWKKEVR